MGAPQVVRHPPRVALIGGGFIGPVHAEALRRLGIPVVGLLGSSPDRAAPAAQSMGIERVYVDLDDLLGDSRVDSVHLTSPNGAHFEQARRVLESGRHIVCEKPLATNSAETNALRLLADSRPRQAAAVHYNVRYYPICQEIRARIHRGDLGRIFSVTGSYVQDWLLRPEDYNWRVEPDGGTNLRATADIGTHWMDLAQHLIGSPIVRVVADLDTVHPKRLRPRTTSETFGSADQSAPGDWVEVATEDYASVLFRMEGGARGNFYVSQVTAGRKNRMTIEIAGSRGAVAWDGDSPNVLWSGRRDAANQVLDRDPALLSPEVSAFARYPGGHAEGFPDTFLQLSRLVYEWIAGGSVGPRLFPTFEDGHREVVLCEAIAASSIQGAWVDVPQDSTGSQKHDAPQRGDDAS